MPVFKVVDFEQSLAFYQEVLGFTVAWRTRGAEDETALLELGDGSLMLSTGTHLGSGEPRFTGTIYFETSGVADFWESVRGKAEVVWPLEEMDYGTLEFGIRDPAGYTLAFSEDRG